MPGSSLTAAKALVAEGRRLAGVPIDLDTGLSVLRDDAARTKTIADAASKRFAESGDFGAATGEILAGVERTRA